MKFRDYIIEDKILNKETPKKVRKCSEQCDGGNHDDFDEDTRMYNTMMNLTKELLYSRCPILKTKSMLEITYLLLSHIEQSYEINDGHSEDDDGGNVFEKKITRPTTNIKKEVGKNGH